MLRPLRKANAETRRVLNKAFKTEAHSPLCKLYIYICIYIYIYIYMDSKNMILMFKGNLNSNQNYELIWTGLLPLRQERRVFV